jgi:hypothetical protein
MPVNTMPSMIAAAARTARGYQRGWWIMAGLTVLGLIPLLLLIRPKPAVVVVAPAPAE